MPFSCFAEMWNFDEDHQPDPPMRPRMWIFLVQLMPLLWPCCAASGWRQSRAATVWWMERISIVPLCWSCVNIKKYKWIYVCMFTFRYMYVLSLWNTIIYGTSMRTHFYKWQFLNSQHHQPSHHKVGEGRRRLYGILKLTQIYTYTKQNRLIATMLGRFINSCPCPCPWSNL